MLFIFGLFSADAFYTTVQCLYKPLHTQSWVVGSSVNGSFLGLLVVEKSFSYTLHDMLTHKHKT